MFLYRGVFVRKGGLWFLRIQWLPSNGEMRESEFAAVSDFAVYGRFF